MPVVDEVEAGAVTARRVQRAVGTELDLTRGMAWVLLAPALDQHGLGARYVAAGREARQTPGNHAAVAGCAGRGGADVAPLRRCATRVAVVRVQHIDVRLGWKTWVERHAQQPAIPKVVYAIGQVGEQRRRRVGQRVVNPNFPGFFSDEYPAVAGKAHDRWLM